jgi:ribonuclease VapC
VLLDDFGVFIAPFDGGLADLAFDGFRRYGKGQGHPAQLNILIAPPMRWPGRAASRCC